MGYGKADTFARSQDRIYAQCESIKLLEYGKETIGRITLPIPNGVSDQNSVSFGQGTLNPVQKAISDTALKTILSASNNEDFNSQIFSRCLYIRK